MHINKKQWTVIEALKWTEQRLARQGEAHPRLAAQMLTSHAIGLSRIELYTSFDKPLDDEERSKLRAAIQRRLKGEPLQYILGYTGFRYIELAVRLPVLIPRPETELLVELVIEAAKQSKRKVHRILEIGVGSGAVALSLLKELPGAHITATDIDKNALLLTRENAFSLKLDKGEALELLHDDLANSLLSDESRKHSFDVLVSNPPYIPTSEYEQLPPALLCYESKAALDGGRDGLEVFYPLARQALELLKPGGLLAVELHEDTFEKARAYLDSLSYEKIEIHNDLNERNRYISALRG